MTLCPYKDCEWEGEREDLTDHARRAHCVDVSRVMSREEIAEFYGENIDREG